MTLAADVNTSCIITDRLTSLSTVIGYEVLPFNTGSLLMTSFDARKIVSKVLLMF